MIENEYKSILDEVSSYLGLSLTERQEKTLLTYIQLVENANKQFNLTSITGIEDALVYHIEDSLTAIPEFTSCVQGRFCDLGTGAGFPGIPLAIATGRKGLLLDSVKKKVTAVSGFIEELEIGEILNVSSKRAEELALEERNGFQIVISRAVSSMPSLIELSAPLLDKKGRLIAMKGNPSEDEIASGDSAASMLGMVKIEDRSFMLSDALSKRRILTYEKIKEPEIELPRRNGMAQKKPIA